MAIVKAHLHGQMPTVMLNKQYQSTEGKSQEWVSLIKISKSQQTCVCYSQWKNSTTWSSGKESPCLSKRKWNCPPFCLAYGVLSDLKTNTLLTTLLIFSSKRCHIYSTVKIYIVQIAQFDLLSVSRARSAIHRATITWSAIVARGFKNNSVIN